ncbi:hypothetical protein JB92DRAFT_1860377 [Gautieria morchelliformis]|nr:hypothetical protein JB92DRAFT_1860377 [Gautieria morchelliformis]
MHNLQRLFGMCLIGVLGRRVGAVATTTATCTAEQWTFNQDQQSPCFVASSLLAACNGGTWLVPAIDSNTMYQGPASGAESNGCQCSTIVYSVISACAACQGAAVNTWSNWSSKCTRGDIHNSSFPLTMPPGLTVPTWAHLDVTAGNSWDINAAMNNHASNLPSNLTSTNSSSQHSANVYAIAGCILGGFVGLVLLGLIAVLLYRKRKKAKNQP